MANEFIARKGLIISGSSFKAESTAIPSGGTSNEVVVLESDGTLKTKTAASGTAGTSGTSGSSGTSGNDGAPGSSGTSGSTGTSGTSGSSGTSGNDGAPGSSGTSGTSGSTGTSGSSGTSGNDGAPGSSGTSGTSGNTGAPGSSGTSGTSGILPLTGTTTNGVITYDGDGTGTVESNLTFDGNTSTLGVIGTVGVGTDNPTYQLHVSSSTAALGVYERAGGAALYLEGQLTRGVLGTVDSHPLLIAYNSVETARFTGTSFLVTGSLDVSTSITGSSAQFTSLPAGSETTFLTVDGSGNVKTRTSGADGSSGTSGSTGTSGSSGTSGNDGAPGSSGSSGTSGNDGAPGSSGTSGTSGILPLTGTTANGVITYDGDGTGTVESNLTFGSNILTLSGNVNASNQSGTTITTTTGGGAGDQTITLGDDTSGNTFIKVDGLTNIILGDDGETVTFDGTNGLVASTNIKGSNIIGNGIGQSIIGYNRSIFGYGAGTGTATYSHQFQGQSGESATFVITDVDGEEIFKTSGDVATTSLTVQLGDISEAGNSNIFKLEEGNNRAIFNNSANDIRVGINTATPGYELTVNGNVQFGNREYSTTSPGTSAASIGDIIRIGTGGTLGGYTYHFDGTGWNQTNANPATSAATSGSLVAMGLGTSATTDGMLLRGIARPTALTGVTGGGQTIYFDSVSGRLTGTVPTTSGYIVRIAGHSLSSTVIYFNPSPDWIILD